MSAQDDTGALPAQHASIDRSIALDLAGGPLVLTFSPDHADLAAETAQLWAHLLRAVTDGAPGDAETDPVRRLRVVTASENREDAEVTAGTSEVIDPGPGAAYALSGAVTRLEIESLIGTKLLLHAGTIRTPELGVLVLVGPSGAGKSTATTVLGRLGEYLTDELTIVDPHTLGIQAFSKPVSRVESVTDARTKRDRDLVEEGLIPIPSSEAPRHVILLRRRRTDAECRGSRAAAGGGALRRVPLAEAVLRIVEQSSSFWTLEDGLGSLARLLTQSSGALEAVYTDAEELAGLLESPPQPLVEEWESLGRIPGQTPQSPDRFGNASLEGALLTGHGIVLLKKGRVLRIQGIGALIWDTLRLEGPLTLARIEARIVEEAGPHPEAPTRIAAALQGLLDEGLVSGALRTAV